MINIATYKVFRFVVGVLVLVAMLPAMSYSSDIKETERLWQKLNSPDHFALIRHALAPGTGDPLDFTLGKCETQRNLSDKGREQARHIGELFRKNGINSPRVYSSQWCRCVETAQLLDLGEVVELPTINSFFRNFGKETAQTRGLIEWLDKQDLTTPHILITHQVNITALTDIFPGSGEIVVVKREKEGRYLPVGTIETD